MVPPSKRAAGDDAAPPSRRLRVTPPTVGPGSGNPGPPPSPRNRFFAIVLVVLFFKRPKDRSTDSSVPVSLSRIRRLEVEIGRLRHGLGQVRETIGTLLRKQDSIKKLIRALSSKLDTIKGSSPNHHNHEQLREGTLHEGTSAGAEGFAKTETDTRDTNIRLRFCNGMKPPIYHDDDIKSIKVEILDGDTRIESGPLSKLKIEVLALEGNFPYNPQDSWTSKEFDEHIAYGRDGKGNVLAGKGTNAQLVNGECHLGSIRFRESSCRARSGKFIVAARVCGGPQAICDQVQEAVMEAVVVLDRRNKYHEKSHPPKPDDEVYRLEKIAINGKYHKRLEEHNIHTVEHFSKALYKDEDNLARILRIKKKCKDWEKMVRHAQDCCLEGKPELKSYWCEQGNVVLFFNYIHRFVGATFGGHYIAPDMFDPVQKNLVEKLKKNAYDQLDGLPGDHVMKDNIPVRIPMDADGGAGPSSMANSAPQQINSPHHIAEHEVEGTSVSEVLRLRPCAPHGPNSIPEPNNNIYNYQAGDTTTFEGLIRGPNVLSFAVVNDGPSTSSSVPSHLTTRNYQDQGTGFAPRQQHFHVVDGMPRDVSSFAVANDGPSTSSSVPYLTTQNYKEGAQGSQDEMTHYAAEWSSDDIFDQLLKNTGVASLPSDGTMGSPVSASHEWFECQGNMPGNAPF